MLFIYGGGGGIFLIKNIIFERKYFFMKQTIYLLAFTLVSVFITNYAAGQGMAVNATGAAANTLTVGASYGGGVIAYLLQSGDIGYDPSVQHGLIAATSDQSTGVQWYNGSYTNTYATGTAIGTGLSNTMAIIANQGAGSYAAKVARSYRGGGNTDWYLPSKDELNKLYINRVSIGGFASAFYWSSSESFSNYVWNQYFLNGHQVNGGRLGPGYVRAVRAF